MNFWGLGGTGNPILVLSYFFLPIEIHNLMVAKRTKDMLSFQADEEEFEAPEITANREDEEPYRLTRLERVYGFVCGQATLLKHMDALKKVTKLH
ncbi:hypothetical protein, partial [aff. Roholtiella sp. LEGE 12411]|uniref:hypothetical protein n=1 Tax=aff. Roholtiella sp. LEGE 12411 TaxID=1828822 RepID=UPI001A0E02DC